MRQILEKLPKLAKDKEKENKKFFSILKRRPPKNLDQMMVRIHEDEFSHTDCLQCGNCCTTTGPLFTDKDITRIAKALRLKPQQFISTYLRVDQDGDHVLQTVPCSFLGADLHCSIYDIRPKACREFPHTDRKKFQQISHLTIKNVAICPAAFGIVETLKSALKHPQG